MNDVITATVKTSAGLVLFHPDLFQVLQIIKNIKSEVDVIFIFLNSGLNSAEKEDILNASMPTELVFLNENGRNEGLGRAYNAFASCSLEAGLNRLVLFDQDSTPPPDMIQTLTFMEASLISNKMNPAVIGPMPIAPSGTPLKTAPIRSSYVTLGLKQVDFVISSGSFINLKSFQTVGPFREDFFIDAIDIEWCFRAQSYGYSIWVAPSLNMIHHLGRGSIRFLGLALTRQPPRRIYTFFRNQLALCRLKHVPFAYKAKVILGFPIRALIYLFSYRFAKEISSSIFYGIRDGLKGKFEAR
jgi:rhamnosyltransferase